MNPLAAQIYKERVVHDAAGNPVPLEADVDRDEGELLESLVREDSSINTTIEVGCAYGLSSLAICAGLAGRENGRHLIVDPFQHGRWKGIGMLNLQRAGFGFVDLLEERSEFALPRLTQSRPASFDFMFIDGNHTMDHTLIDLFYANRLVRLGGYVAVDDCTMPAIAQALAYVASYPAFRIARTVKRRGWRRSIRRGMRKMFTTLIPPPVAGYLIPKTLYDYQYRPRRFTGLVVLQKIQEDQRAWNWYRSI